MGARIGVALSGGGARGLAHLGVLQVMEDHTIPVHALAGTSMGGLIAGLYAAGVPLEELIRFSERVGIIDVAAPDKKWRGLFAHRKLERLLIDLLGTDRMTFADLTIPAAVVAADIETAEMVVLNQGPLIPALTATCAFPLLFSPVRHYGRWLVDGGVVNNLPVDIVRAMDVDRVIGVSVPAEVTLGEHGGRSGEDGRPGLSLRSLRRFTPHALDWRMPFLIAEASMGLAIQLVNQQRLDLCPPDLLIQIPVENVGLFDNGNTRRVIEAGRQAALARLREIERIAAEKGRRGLIPRMAAFVGRLSEAWKVLRGPQYEPHPARFCWASLETDTTVNPRTSTGADRSPGLSSGVAETHSTATTSPREVDRGD